ncbi:DUF3954 domain-containing protein [Sediminibacillus massiliensis]|uniref:DUF3954 domain-containing protein n=1 Tax=Sediminibacillus massiliensis TaxID=1926277 RepID=UPI0009884EDE|nr:DUF3954 domain-containing protein [Sediminibacillus massiliensis]
MKMDVEKKTAEINLKENAVYRVKDGQLDRVDVPGEGFGKQVIHWQDGKPQRYEINYSKR